MRVRPLLLDLFCGAGGAAVGYHRAGFDVVGVDIQPQPSYPFAFWQGDAVAPAIVDFIRGLNPAAIHASPPCQRWAEAGTDRQLGEEHPDLLGPTRSMLQELSLPYVIENIPTAPMPEAIMLCGRTFGLPIVRHRLFEIHPPVGLVPSLCHQRRYARSVDHGPGFYPYAHGSWEADWRKHVLPVVWPWMETLNEAGEAIPPAYTEWIGSHLLAHINEESSA